MRKLRIKTKKDWVIAYIFMTLVVYGISTRFDFQSRLLKYGNPMMTQLNQPKSYGNVIFTIVCMTLITEIISFCKKKSIKCMCMIAVAGCVLSLLTFNLYVWNTDKIVTVKDEEQGVLSHVGYWGGDEVEVTEKERIIELCEKLEPVSEEEQVRLEQEYFADEDYLIDSVTIWITYPEKYGHNFSLKVSVHGESVYVWKGYDNHQKDIVTFYEDNGIVDLVKEDL